MATAETEALLVADQPFVLRQRRPDLDDDEAFLRFCSQHDDLRIESDEEGYLILMSPGGWRTGRRNVEIASQVHIWARRDGTGEVTDSSSLFNLRKLARRAPDASWTRKERLARLTAEQQEGILPIPPDFAVELRSPSDRLNDVMSKMGEYLDAGVRLGWLIDPFARIVYEFRPNQPVAVHRDPRSLSGDPELRGFVLDFSSIW